MKTNKKLEKKEVFTQGLLFSYAEPPRADDVL